MKHLVVRQGELKKFWNIMRGFGRRWDKINVMFHSNRAIFTSVRGGNILSYSAIYEGPKEARTFFITPFAGGTAGDLTFHIPEEGAADGESSYSIGEFNLHNDLRTEAYPEILDIEDDGFTMPSDLPKILRTILKIRSGQPTRRMGYFYFYNHNGINYICSRSDNAGIFFPMDMPNISGNMMETKILKALPGGGLCSIKHNDEGRQSWLNYQSGAWLYIVPMDNFDIRRGNRFSDLLGSAVDLSAIKFTIEKSDVQKLLSPLDGFTTRRFRMTNPTCEITLAQSRPARASISFRNSWGYSGDNPAPFDIPSLKITGSSLARFKFSMLDFRNAYKAGFREFDVWAEINGTFTIRSSNKGFIFSSNCNG